MAFWDDWLGRKSTVQVTLAEAGSPERRKKGTELETNIEPLGYAGEIEPLDTTTRNNPSAVVAAALRTAQERGRTARYRDFELMDQSDTGAMLAAVVDAVLTFEDVSAGRGFKVEADRRNVQKLLQTAKAAADLEAASEEIVFDIIKYGDCFIEPLFKGKELVGYQTYPPPEIRVSRNDKGKLNPGTDDNGYPVAFQQVKGGQVVAGWKPHEMIHIKFWPSKRLLYSRIGLLDLLRTDWRKLQLVEQGMVVARVSRAYPRRVHYVDVTNKNREAQESSLLQYIQRMTRRSYGKKPTNDDGLPIVDVSEDIYISTGYEVGPDGKPYPKLNRTETEDPAMAGLAELPDVTYLRQKLWSQVPSDVVGIKRNTTTDLDTQDIAFTRLLRRIQRQLERGLRGIFDQVLLANGYLPSTVSYRITLPTLDVKASWKYSDARFRASMTVRNVLEMGMASRRWAMRQLYNLSDQEIDVLFEEMNDEANNPIFQLQIAPARNGAPAQGDGGTSITGMVNKAGNDGGGAAPTAGNQKQPGSGAVTKNGIDRGTNLGQSLRGNFSGG